MKGVNNNRTLIIAVIGIVLIAAILVLGTILTADMAQKETKAAVHPMSTLYLDELAGRREQVVENNLQNKIRSILNSKKQTPALPKYGGYLIWCRWRDLNPHEIAPTST